MVPIEQALCLVILSRLDVHLWSHRHLATTSEIKSCAAFSHIGLIQNTIISVSSSPSYHLFQKSTSKMGAVERSQLQCHPWQPSFVRFSIDCLNSNQSKPPVTGKCFPWHVFPWLWSFGCQWKWGKNPNCVGKKTTLPKGALPPLAPLYLKTNQFNCCRLPLKLWPSSSTMCCVWDCIHLSSLVLLLSCCLYQGLLQIFVFVGGGTGLLWRSECLPNYSVILHQMKNVSREKSNTFCGWIMAWIHKGRS